MRSLQPTLLPPELVDRDCEVLQLRHPRTGLPAQFVATDSAIFQKMRVGTRASSPRSLLFKDYVASSAEIDIYVPVNPLFLVLPALFTCKDRFVPRDLLLEMHGVGQNADSDVDFDATPTHILNMLPKVYQEQEDMIKLDLELLAAWFTARVAGLEIPKSLAERYKRAIAPIDPTQPIDETLWASVQKHAAVELICSWLSDPVASWLRSQFDFSELNAHIESIASERAAALALQRLNEPVASAPTKRVRAPAAKKLKPANNKSVLDFFKKA